MRLRRLKAEAPEEDGNIKILDEILSTVIAG